MKVWGEFEAKNFIVEYFSREKGIHHEFFFEGIF